MKKRVFSIAVCSLMAITFLMAQKPYEPIELFPREMMEATKMTKPESYEDKENKSPDKPVRIRSNVSYPTITYYPAEQGMATGAAMIVCPGGGYHILAEDLEGTEICQWLNRNGITAILLRYRVPRREGIEKKDALPLQDAQRAISYVRHHAKQWKIDPDKIGIMGFSAGAHLSASASTNFATRTYPVLDEADKASCRPDYTLLIYPAYLAGENVKEEDYTLKSDPGLPLSSETPPCMMVQTEDDGLVNGTLIYYYNLMLNKIPATMHLYPKGGHGYGMRPSENAVCQWPLRAEDWFRELKLIP